MSERIVISGIVSAVRYWSKGPPDIIVGGNVYDVPEAEADKALAAKRAGKEIEIIEGDSGGWGSRTVRLVPDVVVKARGHVSQITDAECGRSARVGLRGGSALWLVTNAEDVRIREEVEIVSIDGGHNTVRVCS